MDSVRAILFCLIVSFLPHMFEFNLQVLFLFDIDDMKSSKRRVTFVSLIFLLKCLSKSIPIREGK